MGKRSWYALRQVSGQIGTHATEPRKLAQPGPRRTGEEAPIQATLKLPQGG